MASEHSVSVMTAAAAKRSKPSSLTSEASKPFDVSPGNSKTKKSPEDHDDSTTPKKGMVDGCYLNPVVCLLC